MNIKEENQKQLEQMWANFKYLRTSKGWTLEEVSGGTGIPMSVLIEMEEGEDFDIRHLPDLCRFYHVKLSEIFGPLP